MIELKRFLSKIRWVRMIRRLLMSCVIYTKLIWLISCKKNKDRKKEIKTLAWFGAYGNTNIGDDLVFFSLKEYVPKNVIINLSCRQRHPTTTYGVNTFYRKDKLLCKKIIKQSDALWIGGGGLFECYANSYSEGWVIGHLEPLVFAFHYGKPYGIIGVGCNNKPIPNPIVRFIFRKICNSADLIITRDEKSKIGFENNGVINEHLYASFDPVINCFRPLENKKQHIVTIGILAWPFYMWPHFHTKMSLEEIYDSMTPERIAKHKQFLSELEILIEALRHLNYNVVFPVFHFSDTILMQELNIEYEKKIPNIEQYLSQIKDCDLVISMRYHGLITSVLCGKPAISISVQEKMFAFTDNFNISQNEIKIEDFSCESILGIVDRINVNYQEECSNLRSILISKQKEIKKLYMREMSRFWRV